MTFPQIVLAAASLLPFSGMVDHVSPTVTALSSGTLTDLGGANVGRVGIERQGGRAYVYVTDARMAAGATLELLVSTSAENLKAGDHLGPGKDALRAGLIGQAEVRYALPASVEPGNLRSVWVWCRSVRLPSARARLTPSRP